MEYKIETIEPFRLVGISAKVDMSTAAELIGGLWQRWFAEGIAARIEGKLSEDTFNAYTEYEGDHTQPYRCFLGCKVDQNAGIPEGLESIESEGGSYAVFDIHGKLPDVIIETWGHIYTVNTFERRWGLDFDRYGLEAANPEDARLQTYVSIR